MRLTPEGRQVIEYLTLLYDAARDDLERADPDELLVAQAKTRAYKKLLTDMTVEPKFTPKESTDVT